jgi:PAS domain S-box-containing protein
MNITIYSILTFFILLVSLILLFLLFSKRKNEVVKYFLYVLYIFLIWQIIEFIFRVFNPGQFSSFLWRLSLATTLFFGPFAYIFVTIFTENKRNKMVEKILYLGAFLLSILTLFTDLMIKGISEPMSWGGYYKVGDFYFLYALFLIIALSLSSFKLILAYKNKIKQGKAIRSISIGFLIAMGGGVLTSILPLLFNFKFPPLGGLFVLFLFFIFIRAFYIYQLFEIKIKRISLGLKILVAFLFVSITSSFSLGAVSYYKQKKNIEKDAFYEMEIFMKQKGEWLEFYLKEVKNNINTLEFNTSIRNAFNIKMIEDAELAKNEIKKRTQEVIFDIEVFLNENSDMSLADLQNSPEFQKIAVQKIGESGYTALTDYNSLTNRFHENPDIVDVYLGNLEDKLPDFWSIMRASKNGAISEGFYAWVDTYGISRKKYMYIEPIKIKTADNIYLSVASTAYLEEFGLAVQSLNESKNFLEDYRNMHGFENLFLVGADNKIWWEAKEKFGIGTEIDSLKEEKYSFYENYLKTKDTKEIIIFSCPCEKDEMVKIFVNMPIYDQISKELIGIVIAQFSREQFAQIIQSKNILSKDEKIYLTDSEGYIIDGFEMNNNFLPIKIEKSLNLDNCLSYGFLDSNEIYKFNKEIAYYRGGTVVGAHYYIKDLDWCLLLEVPTEKIMEPLINLRNFFFFISFLIIILASLLSYLFSHALISPIKKLTKGARDLAQKNFKNKIKINSGDEFEILGEALNQAGEDLEKADYEQKGYQSKLKEEINLKTEQLKKIINDVQKDKDNLENQQKAMLNILEDANDVQIDLKSSKNDLEIKQKELESMVSLGQKLSKANELAEIADILHKHLSGVFEFKAIAFYIFSQKELKTKEFRLYCPEKNSKEIISNSRDWIKGFLLKKLFLTKSDLEKLNIPLPKVFGKKPNLLKLDILKENCFVLKYSNENLGAICFYTDKKISSEIEILLGALMLTVSVFISGIMSSLKSQQSKIKSLVNSVNNGIIMFDEKEDLVLINPAAMNLAGIDDKKEDLGGFFEAIKKEGYDLKEKLDSCSRKGETIILNEIKVGNKIIEFIISPVKNDVGKIMGSVVIMHDITQIKQIDNMKTEFVSVASHQLRTPLTAIKLFTEMLMGEQVGKLKEDQKKYLNNIYQSTDRMVRLVNDLLNVSRIESGRLSIIPESTFMENFISIIISEVQPLAQAKKCKIEFLKPKKKLAQISIDQNLMRQVIHNLIINSIKYSRVKGGFVSIELKEYNKGDILIKISDNGIGIPRDKQERIFQKFFRADNAVKSETEGTGLGLYVSKMIVKSSGGKIWFESVENKGTTFYVTLPKKGMKKKEGEKGLSLS